jgi:hypothetical protein
MDSSLSTCLPCISLLEQFLEHLRRDRLFSAEDISVTFALGDAPDALLDRYYRCDSIRKMGVRCAPG